MRGGVRYHGDMTLSALFSPHLFVLRDCKCQVSGVQSVNKSLNGKALAHARLSDLHQIKQAAR